ncbi:hypothetical protein [Mycolicibacterium aubagnense]|uniref:hypothetical protein n=1 Tax=Mycolicibacterium aubagnense TaxID=319707 RepID=UPI0010FDBC64|nr:hypothetical protein [Mycolicibacterium aubagnense]TLH58267.1 hypothetical protein C1S80_21040 [Mycolicibacterium aubagnense]WGI34194.1 hypothetical protein QDT91_07525 [Mycolicibacterium aubagnense]
MTITLRRTAALICAGAVAFGIAGAPAAVAGVSADGTQATHVLAAGQISSDGDHTDAPGPPTYSPFARHGDVG